MTLARLAAELRAGDLSPREAVERYLARIEALDDRVNAYITVRAEEALAEAAVLEQDAKRGPLWGVPVALKDVIDVASTPTTGASRVLAGRVPDQDAEVVGRLRAAGAIVLGKLNLHELAYGALSTSREYGPVRNPWDLERVCGGSSGGNGAAIAAGLAAGTIGTDTAGSIRIPAAYCGATGLRPSTGRVSNRGVVPVAWSFDTVGPVCRTAEDCALLLTAIAGRDRDDLSTVTAPVPRYGDLLADGIKGLRIGIVNWLLERADPRIAAAAADAVAELGRLGAHATVVEIPLLEEAGTIQQAMQFQEAAEAHLPLLRTRLADYGDDVRARLLVGLVLPSTLYVTGQRARRVAYEQMRRVFADVDLLAAPAMPVLPPRIGEETVRVEGREVPYRLALIPYNSPWSLVGSPVVVVPCGLVERLPVGLALVGRRLDEATVLRAAHAFQQATDWHERRPPPATQVEARAARP